METPQQRPPSSRSLRERVVVTGLPCFRRIARSIPQSISRNTKAITARDVLNAKDGTAPAAMLWATNAVPQINAASTAKDDCRRELRSIYLLLLLGCGMIHSCTVRPIGAGTVHIFVQSCIFMKFYAAV